MFKLLLISVVLFISSGLFRAQMLPLDCPSDCTLTTVDSLLLQCSCKNNTEISSSCMVQFGWYEKVVTPCQFASGTSTQFNVEFWWNNYKDCGGSTSPPCEYFNGTWLSTPFNQQLLIPPFPQTFFSVAGNASTATSIWVEGSNISGYGRMRVIPVV